MSSGLLTADAITKQCPVSQVLKCWKVAACQDDLESGTPVCLLQLREGRGLSGMLLALSEDMGRVGRDPEAPPWIRFSLPLFLDCARSGLKEEFGCAGLKYSPKSPSDTRECRERLTKQSSWNFSRQASSFTVMFSWSSASTQLRSLCLLVTYSLPSFQPQRK